MEIIDVFISDLSSVMSSSCIWSCDGINSEILLLIDFLIGDSLNN